MLALLKAKDEQIAALTRQIAGLTDQVQQLVARLNKDSSSSSKPPSSDPPARRPKGSSSRTGTGRKPGGQEGGSSSTLKQVDYPDQQVPLPPVECTGCAADLSDTPVVRVQRRQVFDAPPPPEPFVIEYQAQYKRCPGCGTENAGAFPGHVKSRTQYGPEVTARTADLVLGHYVPTFRSAQLMRELCGITVSTGFVASLRPRAAALLGPFMGHVRGLLKQAPVVHADETWTTVSGTTEYLHVVSTGHLTAMHTGGRTKDAIDAGGVLTEISGVLVRDGYAGYQHLTQVEHAWCGAHLLRDLRGIHQADPAGQLWAKAMGDLLADAHHLAVAARGQGRTALGEEDLARIHRRYTGALARAATDNGGKATALAKDVRTLANRFARHREMILRFTVDLAVPFTNNQAERDIRPTKVQQRASGGCWRTLQGVAEFAVVQSYLSTAHKWGITRIDALRQLFTTGPWLPPALAPTTVTAL
ncbi:IS66 family transposase [Kitasatospora sp. NPDC006697]|uniref:IS66 family transposase n=1 Tax=Kitasatospora sp. NPDC006697 TaxID=3364020 RepID=UPI0036AC6D0B